MTDITGARNLIQEEETRFRAPNSESMYTRVGAATNFIMDFQYDSHPWHLNGPYSLFGNATGPDGVMPIMFDMTVVGYLLYNGETGTSGTTTLDIHKLSGGTSDDGTIFSTKPAVTTTAANGSYTFRDEVNAVTLSLPTGHTLAVFSSVDFDRGDALRLDIDAAMTGAANLNFQLLFRPR